MHFPSYIPAINSYLAPFSLLAWHPNLFFLIKHSFMVSVHLFHNQPTKQLPAHSPTYSLINPIILHSLHMAEPPENTFVNPFIYPPFITPHYSLIRAFRTLSFLLIPSKPLRLSICTALILDLSFSFYNIVSLPYIRTGTNNVPCNTSTLKLQIPSIN